MLIDEIQNEILFPIRSKRIKKNQNETSTTSFGHLTIFNRIWINYSGQVFLLNMQVLMLLIHFIYMYQKLYDKLTISFSVHYI